MTRDTFERQCTPFFIGSRMFPHVRAPCRVSEFIFPWHHSRSRCIGNRAVSSETPGRRNFISARRKNDKFERWMPQSPTAAEVRFIRCFRLTVTLFKRNVVRVIVRKMFRIFSPLNSRNIKVKLSREKIRIGYSGIFIGEYLCIFFFYIKCRGRLNEYV